MLDDRDMPYYDMNEEIKEINGKIYKRTGKCLRCGKCCMQVKNDIVTPGKKGDWDNDRRGCKFLEKDGNIYKCLIQSGDIDYKTLTKTEKRFFTEECIPYPNIEEYLENGKNYLTDGCGYKFEEIE